MSCIQLTCLHLHSTFHTLLLYCMRKQQLIPFVCKQHHGWIMAVSTENCGEGRRRNQDAAAIYGCLLCSDRRVRHPIESGMHAVAGVAWSNQYWVLSCTILGVGWGWGRMVEGEGERGAQVYGGGTCWPDHLRWCSSRRVAGTLIGRLLLSNSFQFASTFSHL